MSLKPQNYKSLAKFATMSKFLLKKDSIDSEIIEVGIQVDVFNCSSVHYIVDFKRICFVPTSGFYFLRDSP